jgi:anti-anti-sigma factor
MSRIVRYPEAVVVEMHDKPCFSPQDSERVKQTLIEAGRDHVRLVIDCAAVQALGATFLSVLLTVMKHLGARPGDIVLCEVEGVPLQIVQMTRLDRVFPIAASREEAMHIGWPEPQPRIVSACADDDHLDV